MNVKDPLEKGREAMLMHALEISPGPAAAV